MGSLLCCERHPKKLRLDGPSVNWCDKDNDGVYVTGACINQTAPCMCMSENALSDRIKVLANLCRPAKYLSRLEIIIMEKRLKMIADRRTVLAK